MIYKINNDINNNNDTYRCIHCGKLLNSLFTTMDNNNNNKNNINNDNLSIMELIRCSNCNKIVDMYVEY